MSQSLLEPTLSSEAETGGRMPWENIAQQISKRDDTL